VQQKEEGHVIAAYVHACRETVSIYNFLPEEEKATIPYSLIQAICDYAGLERPEDQEAADESVLDKMGKMTSAIMELLFFYSGTSDKQEVITNIRKLTNLEERGLIRWILWQKQCLEKPQTP